jgi:hypothetical protein
MRYTVILLGYIAAVVLITGGLMLVVWWCK